MSPSFPPSPFWDFSTDLYSRPGVATACLALQERHGLDVNILMYCLWLATAGRDPPGSVLAASFDAVEDWHRMVVRGLRAVRQRLKTPIGGTDHELALALRARVQKIEIDAEHIEQLALVAGAPIEAAASERGPPERAIRMLRAYWTRLDAAPEAADRTDLAVVLQTCFGDDQERVRSALDRHFG